MIDPVKELYEARVYPAMSHPSADPAVNVVAARLAGLEPANPANARILEIGCGTGHHLLPLAKRWPRSEFLGVDFSEKAISLACQRAETAELGNARFYPASILGFESGEPGFDFIIAHGVFSWVPDDVKIGLLRFLRGNLAPSGLAVVSFNVKAGWRERQPLVVKARAIMEVGGVDEVAALEVLRTVVAEPTELSIIDDMLEKGASLLPFDDFAPVNDPWSLADFVALAEGAGLRWLGDSVPGQNPAFPAEMQGHPAEFCDALDEQDGRRFHSVILCRDDAPLASQVPSIMVQEFAVGLAKELPELEEDAAAITAVIGSRAPSAVSVLELIEEVPTLELRKFTRIIHEGITRGWLIARSEPVTLYEISPQRPVLDSWRHLCATENLPLVDAFHRPCLFPEAQRKLLTLMDGSRDAQELKALAGLHYPQLDSERWLAYLAGRGFFTRL